MMDFTDEVMAMVVIENEKSKRERTRAKAKLRIESVDNWHDAWPAIRAHVARFGDADELQIDDDGWLSARQVLLVAFVGKQVAAHVCFSINPGKACLEARLDSHGISDRFRGRGVEPELLRAAVARADALRCEKRRGFKLGDKW